MSSRIVNESEYEPLMSEYIRDQKHLERWSINWIEWDGECLKASAKLNTPSISSGEDAYHLSYLSADEIQSQLGIIAMHLRLGLTEKGAEVWLLSNSNSYRGAIKNIDDVRIDISLDFKKTKSNKIIFTGKSHIWDVSGGEMVMEKICLLAWQDSWGAPPISNGIE